MRIQEHGLVQIEQLYKQEVLNQLCEQSPEANSCKLQFHPVQQDVLISYDLPQFALN